MAGGGVVRILRDSLPENGGRLVVVSVSKQDISEVVLDMAPMRMMRIDGKSLPL